MGPKEDIKWFELIFDVIFVVGLAKLIEELSTTAQNITINSLVNALLLFLILFNAWIRVTMLENKIKVIERYLGTKLKKPTYKAPVFIQLGLILGLIFTFNIYFIDTFSQFVFIYLLLTISNAFLFVIRPTKILIVSVIFIMSLFTENEQYVTYLFLIYIIYETYFTYKNLRIIANSIFKFSRFRPSVLSEFDDIDLCILSYSDFRRKLYIPHLIERLGIAMVVFLAEYVLVSLHTLGEYSNVADQLLFGSLFFLLFFLFYYNYYSSIEYVDEFLLHEKDKRKKYKYGKTSVYVIILYFLSISGIAYMIKNFHNGEIYDSALVFGVIGYLCFEFADTILFVLFGNVIRGNRLFYYFVSTIVILLPVVALIFFNALVVLGTIVLCLILNIIIGKKLTSVEYIIH